MMDQQIGSLALGEEIPENTLDAVNVLRRMEPRQRAAALSGCAPEVARAVFEQFEAPLQKEVLAFLRDHEVNRLLEDLDPDDRVRLLDTLPEPVGQALLTRLSSRERRLTRKLLAFPTESAGHIMHPEYLPLRPEFSVRESLALIRREGHDAGTVNVLPVLDADERLVGLAMLSALVLADPDQRVADIMLSQVPAVGPETDQEHVARLIQEADLLALPVVDENRHLLGLITVDDAMDVIQVEQEEDFARAGASEPVDRPYFSITLLGLARARLVWLLLLALAGTLTVNVISAFEPLLERAISLSVFIPLLIGIGGNCGAQSATTVVRAMAVGDLNGVGLGQVVFREARVGVLLGTAVAALAYVPVLLLFEAGLAATVSLTLVAVCAFATLVGSGMPLLARRFGIDPAVVSAPVVTTLVDTCGLILYFLIAKFVMAL
ncbi:magnesium transporter [Methylocaldum szegediense]|uniref:Magnesium transporter MgtE n=1 Tax=Methylocaldum szegediense TaxID=73780 RepID=A0ABN8X9K1_9GAMM|nr:magnesium transporter [Methylocaldum szegediense]CAI8959496.1 Magnesium transporter MgtE [Methylocaldum szegediense]